MKTALIIGADGQDGSYLAELLLEKGYRVVGWVRSLHSDTINNLCNVRDQIDLMIGDIHDQDCFINCLEQYQPDEIYNLAAPSLPNASWNHAIEVGDLAGVSVTRLLEAVHKVRPHACVYQASSSEMFGNPNTAPQNEDTPFHPRNPYGVAKLYAHWMVVNYRERYGLHAVSGILYNHESPRRGFQFVSRKITLTAAAIKLGLADELRLGDLNAQRDWGYAPDYVRAMWQMLQQEQPEDFVLGTGRLHTVGDICQRAFETLDLDHRDYVVQDPAFMRPPETHLLVADPAKARRVLGWRPSLTFEEMIRLMVESDLALLTTTASLITQPLNCAELERISQGVG